MVGVFVRAWNHWIDWDHCYGEGELKEGMIVLFQIEADKQYKIHWERASTINILKDGIITHQFVPHIKNIKKKLLISSSNHQLAPRCLPFEVAAVFFSFFLLLFMFSSNFFRFFFVLFFFFLGFETQLCFHICVSVSWLIVLIVWLYGFFSVASLFFYLSSRTCIKWIEVAQKNKKKQKMPQFNSQPQPNRA